MTATLPTVDDYKQLIADQNWVAIMELENTLVRLPQPETRQPARRSWIDAALTKLDTIETVSNRNLILSPVCGNPVFCRYDRQTFRFVPDTAGGTAYISLPELDNITIRARVKGRPKSRLRLNGRPPRTVFKIATVWVVDNDDRDNLHRVMDRSDDLV